MHISYDRGVHRNLKAIIIPIGKAVGSTPGSFRKALRVRTNADNPREVFIVKGQIIPNPSTP